MNGKTVNHIRDSVVLFDYIGYLNFFLALVYILQKYPVYYLDCRPEILSNRLFHWITSNGKIIKIEWNSIDESLRYEIHEKAVRETEAEFSQEPSLRRLSLILELFFDSTDIRDAYKKVNALRHYEICKITLVMQILFRHNPHLNTIFCVIRDITPSIKNQVRDSTIPRTWNVRFPHLPYCAGIIFYQVKKIKIIVMLFVLPLWILLQIGIPSLNKPIQKSYQTAIRIYETDLAFYQKHRSIDFIVDGYEFTAKNILFCIETNIADDYRDKLKDRGYAIADMKTILHNADIHFIAGTIYKYLPLWIRCLFYSVITTPQNIMMTIEGIYTGIIWDRFCSKYHCKHYIAYNDTIPKHIIRNTVLRHNAILSVLYVFSCNTTDYFTPPGKKEFIHLHFSYLSYDILLSWSRKISRYYKAHPNTIRSIVNIGCIWSDSISRIRDAGNNPCMNEVRQTIIKKNGSYPQKTIAVFDTTFGGDSPLTGEDIFQFLQGIITLADSNVNLAIIFKMKMPWGHHISLNQEIRDRYALLNEHPRCIVLNGFAIESSEVIAAADLTISACFTSPTVEAWGAGIPGIFFDATGRYKGFYYDSVPKIIAHDYKELEDLIQAWIVADDKKLRQDYINTWIIPEIDSYADGRSLSRFREFLLKPIHSEWVEPGGSSGE